MSIYGDNISQRDNSSQSTEAVSLNDRLHYLIDFDDNVIFINGEIDGNTLSQFILKVRALVKENNSESINVIINSPGGDLFEAFGIIDFMESASIKFNTICRGCAWSAAALILLSGTGVRVASKRSSIMLHEPASSNDYMNISNIAAQAAFHERSLNNMYELLAARSNKDKEWWMTKLRTDMWLSPTEAVELDIINQVN